VDLNVELRLGRLAAAREHGFLSPGIFLALTEPAASMRIRK
jgi:hypothetical protein